jgi:hypothetical protein
LQNSAIFAILPQEGMMRSEFNILPINVNGRKISRVIVDPHAFKHQDITDDVILDLVRALDQSEQVPDDINGVYQYFSSLLFLGESQYRLVWLLVDQEMYIGVITVYRDRRKK